MIRRKVMAAIHDHEMVGEGETVCVAISGGPDSTALLSLLHELKAELKIELSACHINHQLRGEESEEDARFVASIAERFGVPLFLERVDVKKYRSLKGGSIQMAARELRYQVFKKLLRGGKADKIATAHTADDDAETLLINFLRGAGLQGLSGIPPVRNCDVIRPLIKIGKKSLLEYLTERNIDYRLDSSNSSRKYLRNVVRNELVPHLKNSFNPSLTETLRRTAIILGDVQEYIGKMAEEALTRIEVTNGDESGLVIESGELSRLDKALQREVIKKVVLKVRKSLLGYSFDNLEGLRNLACGRDGELTLPGLKAALSHGKLYFNKTGFRLIKPFEYSFKSEGSTGIGELNCYVEAQRVDQPLPPFDKGCETVYVNRDAIPEDARYRNRREGDRFHPLGSTGTQKLKKFFIDRKIPRWQRDSILLLAAGSRVLWVAGYHLSEDVRVTPRTGKIVGLKLRYEAGENGI